jgi:hypothetical protein
MARLSFGLPSLLAWKFRQPYYANKMPSSVSTFSADNGAHTFSRTHRLKACLRSCQQTKNTLRATQLHLASVGRAAPEISAKCPPKQNAEACASQQKKSPHTRQPRRHSAPTLFPPSALKFCHLQNTLSPPSP